MRRLWFTSLLLLLVTSIYISAQPGDIPLEISRVNIGSLSDDQIRDLIIRLEKTGMNENDLEKLALLRGMQPSQISELRKRINDLKSKNVIYPSPQRERKISSIYSNETDSVVLNQKSDGRILVKDTQKDVDLIGFIFEDDFHEVTPENKIFGMNLFRNEKIVFQPVLNIPTPVDYLLGQGDELIIDIWGVSEMTYTKEISPEGTILIPGIGPVYLNGLTIDEALRKLKKELTKIYSGLSGKSPNTYINVSLGNVRSIQVNLAGEIFMPGTYTIPSLSTVFNALYVAGGPTINGSLRSIKLIRDNKQIAHTDFYQFLMDGTLEGNIRLQDQDIIFVEPYLNRVEIQGEIKRPGLFDLKADETLSDLIRFTGGYTGKAYTSQIKLIRKTDRENKIIDITKAESDKLHLQNGDLVIVDSVLNKFENRVEIIGAVYRPGIYEFNQGMRLMELVSKADGLREDAFPDRGLIYRLKDDLTVEVIPFNKSDIENNQLSLTLKKEDMVMIPSIFDLREELFVEILGEVLMPGKYSFKENMNIKDLILEAGGLLESASIVKIEIARRIKNPEAIQSSGKIADIYQFSIQNGLKISPEATSFSLEPFDIIFIRRSPDYQAQKVMAVEGEVHFPGEYTLLDKNERVSSVIQRAGGLTLFAYQPGARLVRKLSDSEIARQSVIKDLAYISKDTLVLEKESKTTKTIGIDLQKILEQPGSKYDIFVQESDHLIIPRDLQTVSLEGAVLYSTTVRYEDNMSFLKYISLAGGFADNAKRRNSYIIYPNGTVNKTSKFIFIKNYPRVEPGSEIYVPVKDERRKLTSTESISIFTATASLSLVLVTLINAIVK